MFLTLHIVLYSDLLQALKDRTLYSSGFAAEGVLFSASAVPFAGDHEGESEVLDIIVVKADVPTYTEDTTHFTLLFLHLFIFQPRFSHSLVCSLRYYLRIAFRRNVLQIISKTYGILKSPEAKRETEYCRIQKKSCMEKKVYHTILQ